MFGEEKFMQKPIHLQQAFAVEEDLIALDAQETPILQSLQGLSKVFDRSDAKLLLEVGAADMSELELQNKFTNEPFLRIGRERAVNRQLSGLYPCDVRLKVVVVLIVRPADIAERSDSQREQVRARP